MTGTSHDVLPISGELGKLSAAAAHAHSESLGSRHSPPRSPLTKLATEVQNADFEGIDVSP